MKNCKTCKHLNGTICQLHNHNVIDVNTNSCSSHSAAAVDMVNRPPHYKGNGIECIDAMRSAFGDEAVINFCRGNAFKYLWRSEKKNGIEDLKKAQWYINKIIELKS